MQEPFPPFVEAAAQMVDAAPFLDQPDILRAMIERDGYLYLRGAVDPQAVDWARGEIIAALVEDGLLDPEAMTRQAAGEVDMRWTGKQVSGIGQRGRQPQHGFKRRRIWETFVERPGVREVFEKAIGEAVNFLPISEYRTTAPGARTPIHQDGAANYGYGLYTAWFPAMPIDAELGGLGILSREPGTEYPPLQETGQMPAELAADPRWRRADYRPGDMVVFGGSTVHCSLMNTSEGLLRLSFEIRFQAATSPAPTIGTIAAIAADRLTVETDDGQVTSFGIDDDTRLRGDRLKSTALIPRSELPGSDLVPGFRGIVAGDDGRAVSVRGVF